MDRFAFNDDRESTHLQKHDNYDDMPSAFFYYYCIDHAAIWKHEIMNHELCMPLQTQCRHNA